MSGSDNVMEHFTDGGLLGRFKDGDRPAISSVCEIAGKLLGKHGAFHDRDLSALFAEVIARIGDGQSPDEAFGWKQPRKGPQERNTVFRDYEVRATVQDLLKEGDSLNAACKKVSIEEQGPFLLGYKTIYEICKGLTADTELTFHDDIFGVDLSAHINKIQHRK